MIGTFLDALTQHPALAASIGGALGVVGSSFALGIRHGIDWDHIAAITDITSTANAEEHEGWLTQEPGIMLTDESHHSLARSTLLEETRDRPSPGSMLLATAGGPALATQGSVLTGWPAYFERHKRAIFLGSLYAIGHASMVVALGLTAILASGFLPDWIDPIMERVVGGTLLLLAAYLFYSLYRFFKGGEDFRLRSRWMLVFAAVGNGYRRLAARVGGHTAHDHDHPHAPDQYGWRTAYGIGLIHGVGAETGTQVLVIATAVGAGSKAAGVAALFAFVAGLLVSNTFVTVTTAAGFASAQRRRVLYVGAGLFAAVLSLLLGTFFLLDAGDLLPSLDGLVDWIGGPEV